MQLAGKKQTGTAETSQATDFTIVLGFGTLQPLGHIICEHRKGMTAVDG